MPQKDALATPQAWAANWSDPTIEQPLKSARDTPSPPPKAPKFFDVARTWDPMMPASQYDDLRFQFFQTHVMPNFRPEETDAAWQDFRKRTERPKVIESPFKAQAALTALSAAARVQGFVDHDGSFQKRKDQLIQLMDRDGLDTKSAQTTGTIVPDLAAFAGLEAATGGVGGLIEAMGAAGSVIEAAGATLRGATLAGRMARGSLTFGTFQAVTERDQGHPAYSFLSGAAQGATWELGLSAVGKVLGGVRERLPKATLKKKAQAVAEDLFTPKEEATEVAKSTATQPLAAADVILAQKTQAEAARARSTGLPLTVQMDNQSFKPRIVGLDGKGQPFTIEVAPHSAYGEPLEQLKGILKNGGQVQIVKAHMEYPSDAVQVLSMIRSLHNESSYQLSLVDSIIDKYGYPMSPDDEGLLHGVRGATGVHGNAIAAVEVKQQFLTALQRGLQRIEQNRAEVAQGVKATDPAASPYTPMVPYEGPREPAKATESEHVRNLKRKLQEEDDAYRDLKAVADRLMPDEGLVLQGGKQYESFVMRNGIPGAHGIFADVVERQMPEGPYSASTLKLPTLKKQLYVRADGAISEFNPKDGAPTDYWHPADKVQRETAWKMMRGYLDRAAGSVAPETEAARNELQQFVRKSVAQDPPIGPRPVYQTTINGGRPYVTTVPMMPDLLARLLQHETPAGLKLRGAEATVTAKRIMVLWNRGASREAKETAADALKGQGLENLVPPEWQYWVQQPEGSIVKDAPGMTQPKDPPRGKWRYSDFARLWQQGEPMPLLLSTQMRDLEDRTGMPARTISTYMQMFRKKAPISKNQALLLDPRVPAVDALRSQPRTKMRRNIIDVVAGRKDVEAIFGEGAYGGAIVTPGGITTKRSVQRNPFLADVEASQVSPVAQFAGVRFTPNDLQDRNSAAMSLYHEDLHLQLNFLRHASTEADILGRFVEKAKEGGRERLSAVVTMHDIMHGITELHPDYLNQEHESLLEESFAHAASAIRVGDRTYLRKLAHWDTDVEHVRSMVDQIGQEVRDHLNELQDFQELRGFKNRIDDLLRRTGRDRFERWQSEAYKQELSFHIDPETQDAVFQNARGVSTRLRLEDEQQALTAVGDHLETFSGFDEAVPSATTQFERMGWTEGIARGKSLVQGSRDRPTTYFMPKSDDNFKGVRAVTSLFEPMLGWAARTEMAFKKRGQDLGLFDAVKDVDDAARAGMEWHDRHLTNASKFISPDPNRARMMTSFMSMEPEVWPQTAQKFGLDQKFLDDMAAARQWLIDYRTSTGIDALRYFKQDLPRLQNMNYSVQAVWPKGLDRSELARIPRAIVEGDLNPQDSHFGHTLAWLIKEGYEAKFTGDPLARLTKLMNAQDAEGNSILSVAKYNVDNYIKYMKGIPDVSQQIMTKAVGDFQKGLGKAFGEVNAKMGTKLPTEFNYPGDLLQKYMLLSYMGGIGLRPAIWARDAMQAVTNTLPVIGVAKFTKGIAALFRSGSWDQAMQDGALLGQHNVASLYGDVYQEQGPQSGGVLDRTVEFLGGMLAPSRWFHNLARAVTYHGELSEALEAVKSFRANKIDTQEFLHRTSAWFFDAPLQTRLLKQMLDKTSEKGWTISHEDMAKKIALETVDHTLWAYRRGTQPLFLRTGVGRIFGQYGLWPLSYIDYMRRLTGKLAEHPRQATTSLALWYAANQAASSAFSAAGGDVSKWFFISPAGYGGSPHLQMAQAIGQSLENSEQGRAARKTILQYPMNFVPAYLELKNVARYISEDSNFFNDDWSLTDNAVRIMGMHPKSQDMNLTPEEELQYQMGFTQRR